MNVEIREPDRIEHVDLKGFLYDAIFVPEGGDGRSVGAAWSRIMNDYGHIDDETPSIALSVQSEFRRRGIATALLTALMNKLRAEGFCRASLSFRAVRPRPLGLGI